MKINNKTKSAVLSFLTSCFGILIKLDAKAITDNLNLALDPTTPKKYLCINSNKVAFMLENHSLITVGLITNKTFRGHFTEAIKLEMKMETGEEDTVSRIRDMMKTDSKYFPEGCGNNVVINFTTYDGRVHKLIGDTINLGFAKSRGLTQGLIEKANKLRRY